MLSAFAVTKSIRLIVMMSCELLAIQVFIQISHIRCDKNNKTTSMRLCHFQLNSTKTGFNLSNDAI